MPYERTKEVQETRDCKFNQTQADGKEKLTKHKPKRRHRGSNQKSRKRFCVRSPPFGRRNGARCKDPECNRRYRKTTIRQHILPIPSPSITSFYSLRTNILQRQNRNP